MHAARSAQSYDLMREAIDDDKFNIKRKAINKDGGTTLPPCF
jgi:hypothetical protein